MTKFDTYKIVFWWYICLFLFSYSFHLHIISILFSESFTADHKPLMGEAPEVRGFFLGCGFNSAGMSRHQLKQWKNCGGDIKRFTKDTPARIRASKHYLSLKDDYL